MNTYNTRPELMRYSMMAILVITTFLTGCKSVDLDEAKTMLSRPDSRVTLLPGDQVDIKFFYTPELNELQQVRPDGMISLQLVGDVMAAGLTPSKLQGQLEKKYTGLIENPSVVVIIRELENRKVYVGGAVQQPGVLDMPGNLTALNAIMQTGGFVIEEASFKNILIIRNQGKTTKSYTLNLSHILDGETPHAPFYLHSQDVIFVQRTGVVKTAEWISQHINQMVPQFGFTYFYNTGTKDSTVGLDTSTTRR